MRRTATGMKATVALAQLPQLAASAALTTAEQASAGHSEADLSGTFRDERHDDEQPCIREQGRWVILARALPPQSMLFSFQASCRLLLWQRLATKARHSARTAARMWRRIVQRQRMAAQKAATPMGYHPNSGSWSRRKRCRCRWR